MYQFKPHQVSSDGRSVQAKGSFVGYVNSFQLIASKSPHHETTRVRKLVVNLSRQVYDWKSLETALILQIKAEAHSWAVWESMCCAVPVLWINLQFCQSSTEFTLRNYWDNLTLFMLGDGNFSFPWGHCCPTGEGCSWVTWKRMSSGHSFLDDFLAVGTGAGFWHCNFPFGGQRTTPWCIPSEGSMIQKWLWSLFLDNNILLWIAQGVMIKMGHGSANFPFTFPHAAFP